MARHPTRRERRLWRREMRAAVPRNIRQSAKRHATQEKHRQRRQPVPISQYDRERNGRSEHIRDYVQERSMNEPDPPRMEPLRHPRDALPTEREWYGVTGKSANKVYYLRRYPHPGKFEGGFQIDEYIWQSTMESGGGGVGDVSTMGFYAEMVELGDQDAVDQIESYAKEAGDSLTPDERQFILDMAGAIVEETDIGFVSVNYSDTKEELESKWADYEKTEEDFYAESEEEEP